MISSPGFPSVVFVLLLSTTLADFERRGISQISFSVTHGWSAFGGADHGWQDVELERRAWTLAQAVSGSVGAQGAAPDVSALRIGADRPWRSQEHSADGEAACARRMRSTTSLRRGLGCNACETELLVQADRLVGGSDAVLVIDDTAIAKKGTHSVGVASAVEKNSAARPRHSIDTGRRRCRLCQDRPSKCRRELLVLLEEVRRPDFIGPDD
jgi:hypothetical protein